MSEDSFTDGSCKSRPMLGDLTNRMRKRGFSLISDDLGLKCGDAFGNDPNGSERGDSQFAKQVCSGVENLVRDKCRATSGQNSQENAFVLLSEMKSPGSSPTYSVNSSSIDANTPHETQKSDSLAAGVAVVKDDALAEAVVEVADVSRSSCVSTVSVPMCSVPCEKSCVEKGKATSNVLQNISTDEGVISCTFRSNDKDLDVGRLASSKWGSIEWSRLCKPQVSIPFELGKCSKLKNDGCADSGPEADLLKSCSCSFCLKAAYIWSDLHYQDIKGRLAVLKKSQKEASVLIQKCGRGKQNDPNCQGNLNQSTKLESDLTGQWRSLFLNTEDIFVRENSQLQASLVTLKDLRDKSKRDLERATGGPSDKY
ncbi:uncharacterized protein LOC110818976 [Carica papaya]|uniref:uncharacterized protein LOC110818976 n=1 Tax=Carica papaya TaxID=3649 RepID=UPI000B8CA2DA|nr:uncharacterized protein LOC110818976 [Carica papaya]XP_021903732.1 uncharacterized protein LOC110818976 [Carica papaya]XP_021903733.1 uncharacterized protein LOC110818976 [Carica papaya]XP_021903734.1 uncharacterized protein LOC110818976 [Carica papaya]